MNRIEIVARGVMVKDGHVLLCHHRRKTNTYFPGGHVELGEPAKTSLAREIKEEMGLSATVGRFLGAAEHTFVHHGKTTCEINLVFELTVRGLRPGLSVPSTEKKLEFLWVPLAKLARSRIEPRILRTEIRNWLKSAPAAWASTYR